MDRIALSAAMPLDLESLQSDDRLEPTTVFIETILSAIEREDRDPTELEFDALAIAISRLGVKDCVTAVSQAYLSFATPFDVSRLKVRKTPFEPGERTMAKLRELFEAAKQVRASPLMEIFEHHTRLDQHVRLSTARVAAMQQVLIAVVLALPRESKIEFEQQLSAMAAMMSDEQDELGAASTAVFDEIFAGFMSLLHDNDPPGGGDDDARGR